jgi:hypothetical protein
MDWNQVDWNEWYDWVRDPNLWQGFYGGALAFASAVGIFFVTRRIDRQRAATEAVGVASLALYEASGVFESPSDDLQVRNLERQSMLAEFKKQLLAADPSLPRAVVAVTSDARLQLTRWVNWANEFDAHLGDAALDPADYAKGAAEMHLWVSATNEALAEFRAGRRRWKKRLRHDPVLPRSWDTPASRST